MARRFVDRPGPRQWRSRIPDLLCWLQLSLAVLTRRSFRSSICVAGAHATLPGELNQCRRGRARCFPALDLHRAAADELATLLPLFAPRLTEDVVWPPCQRRWCCPAPR